MINSATKEELVKNHTKNTMRMDFLAQYSSNSFNTVSVKTLISFKLKLCCVEKLAEKNLID